jgi:ubiquinone biosynthesis O-methyltransferase
MDTAQSTERLTESYARWRSSHLGRITDRLEQQLLFELLGSVADKTLLDVGCGDGALASELARRGAIVTGLDADPVMIAAARQRTKIEGTQLRFIEGQAERLPFDDTAFDRVVAVTVLCFVRDAERAVAEMARVLKPGGWVVIGELGRRSWWAAHRRIRGWFGNSTWQAAMFRTPEDLRGLADAAGLNVVETRGAVHYPPFGTAARFLAPIDLWLGRQTAFGSAFIAVLATKPAALAGERNQQDHKSEQIEKSTDPFAQALRRNVCLYAREPVARSAAPKKLAHRGRSGNLPARSGWRYRAAPAC